MDNRFVPQMFTVRCEHFWLETWPLKLIEWLEDFSHFGNFSYYSTWWFFFFYFLYNRYVHYPKENNIKVIKFSFGQAFCHLNVHSALLIFLVWKVATSENDWKGSCHLLFDSSTLWKSPMSKRHFGPPKCLLLFQKK